MPYKIDRLVNDASRNQTQLSGFYNFSSSPSTLIIPIITGNLPAGELPGSLFWIHPSGKLAIVSGTSFVYSSGFIGQ